MAITVPFGIIFLADPTGVTAGTDEVFENDLSSLDTYSSGRGYGYVAGGTYNPRTRNTALDRRLVGTHWTATNTQAVYRVDLPATGSYTIRTASGDASGGASVYLELFDGISAGVGVTSKGVLSTGSTSTAAAFKDATDVERATPSAWVSNNASITATFSTTVLVLHIGNGLAGGSGNGGSLSYFYIESSGGGGGSSIAAISNYYRMLRSAG